MKNQIKFTMIALLAALVALPTFASVENCPRDGSQARVQRQTQTRQRLQDGSCGKEECDGTGGERQQKRQRDGQGQGKGQGQGQGQGQRQGQGARR